MNEHEIKQMLKECDAIREHVHCIYPSGKHGAVLIDEDALCGNTIKTSVLYQELVKKLWFFGLTDFEVVVGRGIGGMHIARRVAEFASKILGGSKYSRYANSDEDNRFFFYEEWISSIRDKKVLIVDSHLENGVSARAIVDSVRSLNGNVVAVAGIMSNADITRVHVGNVPHVCVLFSEDIFQTWEADTCPLCADNIPLQKTHQTFSLERIYRATH